jgi:tetratricopeptide (TPR) repeat protein
VSQSSSKLARAQEVAALKGLRAAVGLYVEATDSLAEEGRWNAAVHILAEVLNTREKKRNLFGSREINPLGPDRILVGKQFAKLTRHAEINDSILELLGSLAVENPDEPIIRLANAEGLYRGAYMADAIDEYRYCEKLIPDDGAIQARLGELYAIMSRNAEAVDYLRRGIGELMQAQHFDEVPFFARKLLEASPNAAPDILRWLESLPEDAFSEKRDDILAVVDRAREAGLDDARWSALEERLDALPPRALVEQLTQADKFEFALEPAAGESATATSEEAPEPASEPAYSSSPSIWQDGSGLASASDEEIRSLLGAPNEAVESAQSEPALSNGLSAAQQASQPASASYAPSVSIGSTQPTAAGGLPPGLAAFTRRKGDTAYAAGDFAAAASSYERLIKAVFDQDVAANLVDCYLGLQRFDDAAALGLQVADTYAEAGELEKALAVLATIMEHTANPAIERRHSELLAASQTL